jgi:hypothetical protein
LIVSSIIRGAEGARAHPNTPHLPLLVEKIRLIV